MPTPSTALSTTTSSGEALRLRTALVSLKDSLETTDRDVIVLLEEWQEALDDCDTCEAHIAKLSERIREQDERLRELRQTAADCFRKVSLRLTGAAHDVHIQTAPFVTIQHQQALQLQCWLLEGRSWREVRLALTGGQLVYTKHTRSVYTGRKRQVQVVLELDWIDGASVDGDVLIRTSCCGIDPRWQWSCHLSAAGREIVRRDALVFCCETEAGMDFWVRELYTAKGMVQPAALLDGPKVRRPQHVAYNPSVLLDELSAGRHGRLGIDRPPRPGAPLHASPSSFASSRTRVGGLELQGHGLDKDARVPIDASNVALHQASMPWVVPPAGGGEGPEHDARMVGASRGPPGGKADEVPTGSGGRQLPANPDLASLSTAGLSASSDRPGAFPQRSSGDRPDLSLPLGVSSRSHGSFDAAGRGMPPVMMGGRGRGMSPSRSPMGPRPQRVQLR